MASLRTAEQLICEVLVPLRGWSIVGIDNVHGRVMGTVAVIDARVVPLLRKSALLGSLPESALGRLVRRGQCRLVRKSEVLCWRGDPGDSAMLILSGGVKVSNTSMDGREIGLNFLSAGDLVGEIAALDGRERTATVTAIDDSEVFIIYRESLLEILASNPDATSELLGVLCERLRTATAIIEDGVHEMQGRLARGLLRLALQHGTKQRDRIRINLRLSQTELGNYVGLSRPNVSRQLTRLKELGLIEMDGSTVVILDEPQLSCLAEHGPSRGH